MDSGQYRSGSPAGESRAPTPVKIVIAGGFGVGKTTFVGAVSEIIPLTTEAAMTTASVGVDDTSHIQGKTTTTVAMDFGRITLDTDLILYLFGTPGQDRFWFMWDDLCRGAIGAVVLVDTRRLDACFAAVDYFEQRELPFVVAINCFDGVLAHAVEDVREALVIGEETPIVACDARVRESAKATLIELVQHALARASAVLRSPADTRGGVGAGSTSLTPAGPMPDDDHVRVNRRLWNDDADDYQRRNAAQIRDQAFTGHLAWGTWNIPESELGVLGDVAGKDILEFGCGGAQWSTALARNGAHPFGFDLSERQLAHALALRSETGIAIPLVQADAERTPFRDASFDIVFADYGAFLFADPYRAVPEATRILRPGGLLAFTHISPIYDIAFPPDADHPSERLVNDYFGLYRMQDVDGTVEFNLPYGTWIGLFRDSGLVVEGLIEPRPGPGATSTYRDAEDLAWSRRWPAECIWRLRKP